MKGVAGKEIGIYEQLVLSPCLSWNLLSHFFVYIHIGTDSFTIFFFDGRSISSCFTLDLFKCLKLHVCVCEVFMPLHKKRV